MPVSTAMLNNFIEFLCSQGIIEEEAAGRARNEMARLDLRFGRVALLEGFVTPEEINKVLWVQREALDKKFGEIAVELGIMTQEEVRRSLELQNDEMFAFCQALILDGQIAPPTLFAVLKGFLERNLEQQIERHRLERHSRISQSIRDVLKRITVLAPMPGTIARLLQMLNDPNVDLDEVAKVISVDVGLTAMLIRLANSAFYGLKSAVTTVNKAVTVLGIKKIRQLILSAAVMENFKNLPPHDLADFWQHSMRVAQWSKEIATHAEKIDSDEFFLAGFLHNIGELVICQHFRAESRQIAKMKSEMKSGKNSLEAERAVMGCDHADIGSYLLNLWQLTPAAIQAAMLHNHPRVHLQQMSGISMEAKVVNMAVALDACHNELNHFGEGMNIGQTVEDYKSIVPLDGRRISDMHTRVEQTVSQLMSFFK